MIEFNVSPTFQLGSTVVCKFALQTPEAVGRITARVLSGGTMLYRLILTSGATYFAEEKELVLVCRPFTQVKI